MESNEAARARRAQARAARVTRVAAGHDAPTTAEERVSLVTALSRWAHELSGLPTPTYARSSIPVVRRRLRP